MRHTHATPFVGTGSEVEKESSERLTFAESCGEEERDKTGIESSESHLGAGSLGQ